jgi:hypothetical protein
MTVRPGTDPRPAAAAVPAQAAGPEPAGAAPAGAAPAGASPAGPAADTGEQDLLAQVTAENPEFRIWRETTALGTRYICRSLDLRLNPYTLVTVDLGEMAVMLSDARRRREQRPSSPIHAAC